MNRTSKVHVNDLKRFKPPREPAVAQSENLNVSSGEPPPARRRGRPRKLRTGRVGRPRLSQGARI